jgi:hypothetical protein
MARHVLLWSLGGLGLVALAKPAPGIATMLVLILIAGLVLGHWSEYSVFLVHGTSGQGVKQNGT